MLPSLLFWGFPMSDQNNYSLSFYIIHYLIEIANNYQNIASIFVLCYRLQKIAI